MTPSDVLYFGKTTVMLIFYLSMPVIGAATAVGLVVAMIQTLIQLQEQTLGFAVKLATVIAVFILSGAWMTAQMLQFTEQILTKIGAP
jgi:type III secretion HrpO family protein